MMKKDAHSYFLMDRGSVSAYQAQELERFILYFFPHATNRPGL